MYCYLLIGRPAKEAAAAEEATAAEETAAAEKTVATAETLRSSFYILKYVMVRTNSSLVFFSHPHTYHFLIRNLWISLVARQWGDGWRGRERVAV